MSSTTDTTPPQVVDNARQQLAADIRSKLGDAVIDVFVKPGDDMWVRVRTETWREIHQKLRDSLDFDYFCFLSAIDWMPSPFGRGEDDPTEPPPIRDTTIRSGYAGGDTRMQVFTRLVSSESHLGVTFKVDVADDQPSIESIASVYAGANWHEREAHEMFGIDFVGHPDLRNLYLPIDFEGHPLRKDFPLLARMVKPWPGIVDVEPLPAGAADDDEAAT
ncbi:MAG: NADH-quinone oxidoreductase subunit C [Ilumatobacteraceae bacterium]